ncbi:sensor histidine kinase [Vibrio intestinalis]|uniref:sensor histidine kinase n=1 Tax=Vibrio intestinalis TaxID=2933291 RepID=UPI0021A2D467|nr:HAMP domain-containing sensor histidine kinase [Vibrio intestinalis]
MRVLRSSKSLTGRLAIFFIGLSCTVGVVTFMVFLMALQWSEDRVGERRILLDRDIAAERFIAGENGKIRIDMLTNAYNDLSLIPKEYRDYLQDKESYLGEVGFWYNEDSLMVYKGQYAHNGEMHDLVLLSLMDQVELTQKEIIYSGVIVISFVSLLMFAFGTLLYRLSSQLIEPLNGIALQLENQTGDSTAEFTISPEASVEFQTLTAKLNQYRTELNHALKREQAFARYASHELRTPLTVVKGATKLIERTETKAFNIRQIGRISNATEQMITMVDALLSIVRYERNVEDAPLRQVSEQELSTIVNDNSLQATDKQLQVDLEVQSLPQVRATEPVMHMILGNLIRNGVAATSSGAITITISADQMQIIDDGPGLDSIPNKNGHGLGLLIVDDLCRRYEWQFSLSNHPTRGCIATIHF